MVCLVFMSRLIHRRLHHVRAGVFFVLILSLMLPPPAVVVAQEVPPSEIEPSVTADDTSISVPANEHVNENATEGELLDGSVQMKVVTFGKKLFHTFHMN
jgi:hypothetical protein